jgi:hypothetical protein
MLLKAILYLHYWCFVGYRKRLAILGWKCVPMFVTVLPVLINHEHRHFLFIIKTYILVERLQKQTFVKNQTSQGKKKEGFRR